jgi:hypothetical protein
MDERIARIVGNITKLEALKQFEINARARNALTDEIRNAVMLRAAFLCRADVAEKTGLDFTRLSPAEEKIVQALTQYVGIQSLQGKYASRTIAQIRSRGLRGAAEESVSKLTPPQGFTAPTEADVEELSYEQIIVDHPTEFSERALWYARRTLGLSNELTKPPPKNGVTRNPAWSRDELIMALDLYLRFRHALPAASSAEVGELSAFLGKMGTENIDEPTYRNANGVYMKMMNFMRFDPEYTSEGKVGLVRGNKEEEGVWAQFSDNPIALAAAVTAIRSTHATREE